ncbi:hypothetical protein [Pseudooceanicola sp. C21-150M6]|uniref:hypothetical protein n=1 Tax=Pseudooceanicola sp. C21-150M6 TaxID=3434355 RepID=UPI003D7F4B75
MGLFGADRVRSSAVIYGDNPITACAAAYKLTWAQAVVFYTLAVSPGRTVTVATIVRHLHHGRKVQHARSGTYKHIRDLGRRLPEGFAVENLHGVGYRLTVPEGWEPPWE